MRPSALQLERGDAIDQVAVCWQKQKINWREPKASVNTSYNFRHRQSLAWTCGYREVDTAQGCSRAPRRLSDQSGQTTESRRRNADAGEESIEALRASEYRAVAGCLECATRRPRYAATRS